MKKYLFTFLIFSSIVLFSQDSIRNSLIYTSCKKIEKEGNDALNDCFKQKFKKDFYKMVSMELRSRKLNVNYLLVARFKLIFDKKGIVDFSGFEGSDDTKDIVEKSLLRLNERIRMGKYKIIPAMNNDGEFVETKLNWNFKYAFVRS